MTEQEIVNCLKENKKKGIAFCFMPEDVWDWVRERLDEPKLLYLNTSGDWKSVEDVDFDDFDNFVFALEADYELPQKPSGDWVEFDIIDNAFICSDKKEHDKWHFFWWDWQTFLTESDNSVLGYTAFGGWQYKDGDRWYLAPAVKLQDEDGDLWNSYVIKERGEAIPAIPIKIRFWRENK